MPTVDELLTSIFEGKNPSLAAEFEGWVRSSRRFKAFATTYHDKIRAKLNRVSDDGGRQDVRAELETAVLLLQEERFTLEYEKYAASKQRGPDFTVTYKTHTPFNVEVRRIRRAEWDETDPEVRTFKLVTVLGEKLGQMPPSIVNLLWLMSERAISVQDLNRAVTTMRQLADRKDADFLTRRGFLNSSDFYKQFQRMSGVVLCNAGTNVVWLNALAKHQLSSEVSNAIRKLRSEQGR